MCIAIRKGIMRGKRKRKIEIAKESEKRINSEKLCRVDDGASAGARSASNGCPSASALRPRRFGRTDHNAAGDRDALIANGMGSKHIQIRLHASAVGPSASVRPQLGSARSNCSSNVRMTNEDVYGAVFGATMDDSRLCGEKSWKVPELLPSKMQPTRTLAMQRYPSRALRRTCST